MYNYSVFNESQIVYTVGYADNTVVTLLLILVIEVSVMFLITMSKIVWGGVK